ncbi:MAG: hypothetical protein J1G01_01710 [Clostridiales bacterium]|nr:hypothetical protein [Clostridiales bacterium]
MERKESTPERERKRTYEEKHKDERKAKCKIWGTSVDRKLADEIDEFLAKHKITKVAVITAGFQALKEQFEPDDK